MATKPYPSNIIIFNVDDRILDDDLKLALKRSWTHIGEMLVRPHAASEGSEPRNIMHVVVKYGTRSYLRSGDEERDANWSERMEQHLLSTMRKISNNNIAFNRRQRKTGDAELAIDAIEFELEAGALTLEYRLDSNGCVPASCAHIATDIRAALNAGVLGEPVRVKAPSDSSYRRQAHAYAQLKAEEAARAAVEEETRLAAEEAERLAAEAAAVERFAESPELAAEVEREEAEEARKTSPLEVPPLTDEEWEAEYGVLDADFEIDYRLWEAVYADGSSREFDPSVQQFVS